MGGPSDNNIDFARIATVAVQHSDHIVSRWLPQGRRCGDEWVALNPKRMDRRSGSFKVNLRTGRWADFATGDRGGDLISLAAYLANLSQSDAAVSLANMLGIDVDG